MSKKLAPLKMEATPTDVSNHTDHVYELGKALYMANDLDIDAAIDPRESKSGFYAR